MLEKAITKIQEQSKGNAVLLAIGDYLIQFMKNEPSFAEKVMDEKKSMKDMLQYVMSEAKKQSTGGAACLKDEVVFGMAVHYFDEKDIKFKPVAGAVATSSSSDKTDKKQKPVTQTNKKEKVKEAEVKPETKPEKPKKAKKEAKPDMMISIFDIIGE